MSFCFKQSMPSWVNNKDRKIGTRPFLGECPATISSISKTGHQGAHLVLGVEVIFGT